MGLPIRSEKHLLALAYFCKRFTFDDAYRRAHGETEEERKSMAYTIMEALSDIQTELEKAGYAPR